MKSFGYEIELWYYGMRFSISFAGASEIENRRKFLPLSQFYRQQNAYINFLRLFSFALI